MHTSQRSRVLNPMRCIFHSAQILAPGIGRLICSCAPHFGVTSLNSILCSKIRATTLFSFLCCYTAILRLMTD
ncbi:hypothetical protein BDR03DRAFT_963726 [Suillus americanus]|nr:hypothetical protein BDR03DRAFT_963726 [Suillus americanus]